MTPRDISRRIGRAHTAGAWCFCGGVVGVALAALCLLTGGGFLASGALACIAGVLLLASDVLITAALNVHLSTWPRPQPVEPHNERV